VRFLLGFRPEYKAACPSVSSNDTIQFMAEQQRDMREVNREIADDYRTKGIYSRDGMPLVVLTTKGAKTGVSHTTPVAVGVDGDALVVAGSKGGLPDHPQWYRNILADPIVTVEYQDQPAYLANARTVEGDERARLFTIMLGSLPALERYEAKAEGKRVIPIIRLERV